LVCFAEVPTSKLLVAFLFEASLVLSMAMVLAVFNWAFENSSS
jgi:hypothetical protein